MVPSYTGADTELVRPTPYPHQWIKIKYQVPSTKYKVQSTEKDK